MTSPVSTWGLSSGAPVLPTQTHTDNKARASQSTSHPVFFNRNSEATPKEHKEGTNLNKIYVVFPSLWHYVLCHFLCSSGIQPYRETQITCNLICQILSWHEYLLLTATEKDRFDFMAVHTHSCLFFLKLVFKLKYFK